jgi:hypothetical protein
MLGKIIQLGVRLININFHSQIEGTKSERETEIHSEMHVMVEIKLNPVPQHRGI